MTRQMCRYEVTINDQPQGFSLSDNPRHVAAAQIGVGYDAQRIVEFWAESDPELSGTTTRRIFQVFGTGHPLPAGAMWWGTTDRKRPRDYVWHLYELVPR